MYNVWGIKHLWFLVGFKKCPICANLYIAYFFTQYYHIVDCKDNVDHPVKRLLESLKIISYFHFSLVVRLIWLLGLNFTVCQVRWARRVTPWKWVLLDRASRPKEHFFYHLKNWNIFSNSSDTFLIIRFAWAFLGIALMSRRAIKWKKPDYEKWLKDSIKMNPWISKALIDT